MITLEQDQLYFRFPEVHADAILRIGFQRTLRVPDDNREYPLPAGLGNFPIRHVDDYAERLPPAWRKHGGVMLPLYQAEALWLNFSALYPMALKISAGMINAVTGDAFSNELRFNPQDYLVVPEQPWLDGFNAGKGIVRQFVAMPLGEDFTAEEQLTGQATHGGIQIVCYPMKRDVYEALQAGRARFEQDEVIRCYSRAPGAEMGLAPGGMIRQQIHEDEHGIEAWDTDLMSRCFVHLANSLHWAQITGQAPPQSPITKREYESKHIPWFDYYFSDTKALQGSEVLRGLDSVAAKAIKKGQHQAAHSDPVVIGKTTDLSVHKRVRDGEY